VFDMSGHWLLVSVELALVRQVVSV
jgi:hypothetical protein